MRHRPDRTLRARATKTVWLPSSGRLTPRQTSRARGRGGIRADLEVPERRFWAKSAPLSTASADLRVAGTAIAELGRGSPFNAATCAATARSEANFSPVGGGGPAPPSAVAKSRCELTHFRSRFKS